MDHWLDALPQVLGAQALVLRRLLAGVRKDSRWQFLEVSCSVARGAGDRYSDLDLGLGARAEAWPDCLQSIDPLVSPLGEVVDILHHRVAEWGDRPHQRTFVQYRNGVQLDLVTFPTPPSVGLSPQSIALHDPDGLLRQTVTPDIMQTNPRDVREWAFLGWTALADLTKYLRRGSLWEALQRLHEARTQVWRLWAAAQDIPYPLFGLPAVLDEPRARVPPGIQSTVAALELNDLLCAGRACALLLERAGNLAAERWQAELPTDMAAYVQRGLQRASEELAPSQPCGQFTTGES